MTSSSGIVLDLRNLADLHDDSRNHHTITNNNGVVVRGMHGQGVYFNGTDAYLDIGDLKNNVNTIEMWCKPISISVTEEILDLNGTAYIKTTAGTITAEGFTTPIVYTNGIVASIISTNWNHIVATTTTSIDASDVDVGRLESSTWFNGVIHSVTFFNYVLDADTIKLHYRQQSPYYQQEAPTIIL